MSWNIVTTKPDGSQWVELQEVNDVVARIRADATRLSFEVLGMCQEMKYLAGIVERGTGEPVTGDVPIVQAVLGYVMYLENEIADAQEREKAFRIGLARARDLLSDIGKTEEAQELENLLARFPVAYALEPNREK